MDQPACKVQWEHLAEVLGQMQKLVRKSAEGNAFWHFKSGERKIPEQADTVDQVQQRIERLTAPPPTPALPAAMPNSDLPAAPAPSARLQHNRGSR